MKISLTPKQFENEVEQIAKERFGENFKFRSQQKEAICDILCCFFEGVTNLYLLDAPTGSGKSVIAMILADFINRQKLRGYILATELSLFDQYVNDFDKHFHNFGKVKGVDNYWCAVNSDRFSMGECRMRNLSYEESEKLPCYPSCGYFNDRKKAIAAPTTLLTYAYWLIQRNYVEPKMIEKGSGIPFTKRDFTICDEAHKIGDIVQNHFSPKIDDKTLDKLEKLRSVLIKSNLIQPRTSNVRIRTVIRNLQKEEDNGKLYALLKEFELQLVDFKIAGESIKSYVAMHYPKDEAVPREWRWNLGLVDWVKDMHCKFEDYNHIISQTGIESIVKNPQSDENIVFNCLDESYMMNKHFHEQAGFKLLMSATLGDAKSFLQTISGQNARYFRIESTFDFTKSPIYFFSKHRMSMAEKEKNLPWVIEKIEEILDEHDGDNGIIHSGSYEITSKIWNSLSEKNKKRVLIYKGTEEKKEELDRFIKDESLVLMGPSILEGLDLAQEKSRFQIFVKVPFPSLGDRFVKAKMSYQPAWYDWKTCLTGDTKISSLDGKEIRLDELKDNEEFFVYSCDSLGEIFPAKAINLGITKHVKSLIKVTLDNDESFTATPEHLIMNRDGNFVKVENLKIDDSVMPLYRNINKNGYEEVLDNKSGKWTKTHQIVGKKLLSSEIERCWHNIKSSDKQDKRIVLHHIDFNSLNNHPNNLKWMGNIEHWKFHSDLIKERFKDFDEKNKIIKALSDGIKNKWKDPTFREKMRRIRTNSEKYQLSQKQKIKKMHDASKNKNDIKYKSQREQTYIKKQYRQDNPNYRSEISKLNWAKNGEHLKTQIQMGIKNFWSIDENRENASKIRSVNTTKQWKNPEYVDKMKKVSGENARKNWTKENYREKMIKKASFNISQSNCNPEHNRKRVIAKIFSVFNKILLNNKEITVENFIENKPKTFPSIPSINKIFSSFDNAIIAFKSSRINHKIKSLESINLDHEIPVYDIHVPEHNVFALSCGIFVHNCTGILQGIGRSVRSDDDWAVTYFLDGCLSDLFRRSRKNFPSEFTKRVKVI